MIQDIFINIGVSSSSSSYEMPYRSYYYKNKLQFVLTKTELESFGIKKGQLIHALHLKSTAKPSRDLKNFRIRIGQTNNDVLTTWEKDNLILVFQGTVPSADLVANTTKIYDFIFPYVIGDGNLLIEVSRDETTGANNGAMGTRTGFLNGKMIGWKADSGASFPFDNVAVTPFNFILDVSLSVEKQNYKLSGAYITPTIPRSEPLRIAWLEDKPTGTDITIEYTTGTVQGEWLEVSNRDVITSDTNLWFRITLETTDTSVTPTLQDLWIESPEAPADTIRLIMNDYFRFNNVAGDLTVFYDGAGSLAGFDGPVEEFTESFTPIDLVAKPHQDDQEHIEISSVSATGKLTRIYFSDIDQAEDQGHIEVLGITSATGVLTHIDNI